MILEEVIEAIVGLLLFIAYIAGGILGCIMAAMDTIRKIKDKREERDRISRDNTVKGSDGVITVED